MAANERQVGGSHYKTDYEHWDLQLNTGQSYLASQVAKYVARWRKKNGVQDLEKSLHFLDKLIENASLVFFQTRRPALPFLIEEVSRFARINELTTQEKVVIELMTIWRSRTELNQAHDIISDLIEGAREGFTNPINRSGTPDPKPVPLTEENHHGERAENKS